MKTPWQFLLEIQTWDRAPGDDEEWMTARLQNRWPGPYHVEKVIDYEWQSVDYEIVFDTPRDEVKFRKIMSLLEGANGRKFILSGPFDEEMPYHYIVISDISFWNNNEPAIYAWMDENLPRGRLHQTGMVIELDNERDALAFLMRWA